MIITSVLLKWLPTIMEAARLPDVGSCDVILTIPRSYPSDAEPLDPRLVAFSLEGDRWPEWAGSRVGQPNRFTEQVLQNLYERTDFRPAVRVGADSEDRTHLDLSLHVGHAIYPPSTPEFPYPEAARITLGRDWFALSRNFANMTPFTWGLNFKSLNVTETRLQARLLAKTFGQEGKRQAGSELWLEAVEIGNEPELYTRSVSGGGVSNPGNWTLWSVQNYTQTWSAYARAVAGEIDLGEETGTVLRVGDIQLAGPAGGWNPQSLMHAGLLDTDFNRKHVKIYSEHLYLAGFEPGHEAASGVLMDKTHIRNNLTLRARNIAAARKAGLSYVLVCDMLLFRCSRLLIDLAQGESSSYSGSVLSHPQSVERSTHSSAVMGVQGLQIQLKPRSGQSTTCYRQLRSAYPASTCPMESAIDTRHFSQPRALSTTGWASPGPI